MANHTDDGKPNERLVRLDDGEMHVVEDGRASAPALLLIHGTAGSTAWWDPIVPVLAETRRPGGAGVALSGTSGMLAWVPPRALWDARSGRIRASLTSTDRQFGRDSTRTCRVGRCLLRKRRSSVMGAQLTGPM